MTEVEEFNIFGDLDVDDVPDDPFYIEPATYPWVVTKAEYRDNKLTNENAIADALEKGFPTTRTSAVYTLSIDDASSQYHGQQHQQWFTVYPHLTRQKFAELENEQKGTILKAMANHKMFLRGLGFSESEIGEINRTTIAEHAVGRECMGKLTVSPDKNDSSKTWRNLVDVKPREDAVQTDFTDFDA